MHRRLLKMYGDDTVDVSTVRRWVLRFNSGESDVHDKPHAGRPCSAATPHNEQRLHPCWLEQNTFNYTKFMFTQSTTN
jgi:transposase